MKKNFLEVGKVVGTHGIHGELRVMPWSDKPEFLTSFKHLYADAEGTTILPVVATRVHKSLVLLQIAGIDTIESAERLRDRVLYIFRGDVDLPKDRYFVQDLVGCRVYDADTGDQLGELTAVSQTGANDVWHVQRGEKDYLVPAIPDVVVRVDINSERIELRPLKGIFDDEN